MPHPVPQIAHDFAHEKRFVSRLRWGLHPKAAVVAARLKQSNGYAQVIGAALCRVRVELVLELGVSVIETCRAALRRVRGELQEGENDPEVLRNEDGDRVAVVGHFAGALNQHVRPLGDEAPDDGRARQPRHDLGDARWPHL